MAQASLFFFFFFFLIMFLLWFFRLIVRRGVLNLLAGLNKYRIVMEIDICLYELMLCL